MRHIKAISMVKQVLLFSSIILATGEATAADPIFRDHYVILRVVYSPSGFVESGGGFASAMLPKKTAEVDVYDVMIWDEIDAVHAYAFDNSFDPNGFSMTPEEWTAHRESYLFRSYTGMPGSSSSRSTYLRETFTSLFADIHEAHPGAGVILSFSGHGSGGGNMFQGQIRYADSIALLRSWKEILGRNIDCIDFGGPCNKAALPELFYFSPFCSYYIASDLPNGGYTVDNFEVDSYYATDVDRQYPLLLNGSQSLEDLLQARIDVKQARYDLSYTNMVNGKVEQANYLFECEAVLDFAEAYVQYCWRNGSYCLPIQNNKDVRSKLELAGETNAVALFDSMIVHSAHNRDFFTWEEEANGAYSCYHSYIAASVQSTGGGETVQDRNPLIARYGNNITLTAVSSDTAEFVRWREIGPGWVNTITTPVLSKNSYGNYTYEAVFTPYEIMTQTVGCGMTNGALSLLLGPDHGTQVLMERSTNLTDNVWETVLDWEPVSSNTIPVLQYDPGAQQGFFRAKTRSPL